MKKFAFLIVFLITGIICFGQRLQPARPYLSPKGGPKMYYSTSSMKRFALENTPQSNQFKDILFFITGEEDINSIFEKVRIVKDTILQPGTYMNSGWNPLTNQYESFPGKYYEGNVTVYEDGYEKILLYKNECGNVLGLDLDDFYQWYQEEKYVVRETYRSDLRSDLRNELTKTVPPEEEEDWSTVVAKNVPPSTLDLNLPPPEDPVPAKREIKIGWIVIPSTAILLAGGGYLIWKNQQGSDGGRITPPGHGDEGGRVTNGGH